MSYYGKISLRLANRGPDDQVNTNIKTSTIVRSILDKVDISILVNSKWAKIM